MDIEAIEEWVGRDVVDQDGDKVGRLGEVHFRGDEAIIGEVRSGRIAKKTHLVPLTEASAGRDYLRIPFGKDVVDKAPAAGSDGAVSAEEVDAVSQAFGRDLGDGQGLESASARGERLAAAAEKLRRADELEAEAERLAREAEDAVARARDADREADEAIEARDRAEAEAKEARAKAGPGAAPR